jgi:uncharacterized membrane protein YphA (DoxX/SURF4 family)
VLHGRDKFGDLSGAEQFFASLDIPAPGLMAPFVALAIDMGTPAETAEPLSHA